MRLAVTLSGVLLLPAMPSGVAGIFQAPASAAASALVRSRLTEGRGFLEERRYPEAMDSFEAVLSRDLQNGEARQGELAAATALALEARRAGNQQAALACLEHAREHLPDDATLLTDLGIQAQLVHELKLAGEALEGALRLQPNDPAATYALARVETDRQQFPAAEPHMRAYLAMRPDDASAHFGLGHLLYMEQRLEEARAEFERSIVLQPVQTESYYQLGQMDLDAHRDAEAAANFEKTLGRDPHHGGALTGMGIVAYRAKEFEAARGRLTAAVASAPEYQPAHYYLGLTLARVGDKAASHRELAIATQLAEAQQGVVRPPAAHP